MKINKIAIVLIFTMLFGTGCSKQENIEANSNSSEPLVNGSNDSITSDKNMYKIYEDRLQVVKEFYIQNDIPVEEEEYEGNIALAYSDNSKNNIGDIGYAQYAMSKDEGGKIEYIKASISLIVGEEEFKVEDSILYELSNIMISKDIDYSDINEEINQSITDSNPVNIVNEYDNIQEDILIADNIIDYVIRIKP